MQKIYMYSAFQRGTVTDKKHKWKELCGRVRDTFFDPTSKVNKGGGNQAEHSGLRFLTALIGVLVYLWKSNMIIIRSLQAGTI